MRDSGTQDGGWRLEEPWAHVQPAGASAVPAWLLAVPPAQQECCLLGWGRSRDLLLITSLWTPTEEYKVQRKHSPFTANRRGGTHGKHIGGKQEGFGRSQGGPRSCLLT